MAYSFLISVDGSLLETIDGAAIVVVVDGPIVGGCLAPLAPNARALAANPPPPNVVTPAQFSPLPAGLVAIPLTLLEQLPDRVPAIPSDAVTAYTPIDRFTYVETILDGFLYDPAMTMGCQAFAALEAVVAAIRLGESENAGYLLWEGGTPAWGGHACVSPTDGRRYWSNIVAYPDGAFYWILGGLGGYGLEPYWVFGGLADPALFVAP